MKPIVQYSRRRLARLSAPARIRSLGPDEFSGYASLFGIADGSGDIVAPGAFAASLRKRPPAKVRMLYQHSAFEPIGVWTEIREDVRGLFVHGRLVTQVVRAREVMRLIREGAVGGLSIGFRTVRADVGARRGTRILKEIELWEISIVTFPMSPDCQVVAVGPEAGEGEEAALGERIRTLSRKLADGAGAGAPN